MTESNNVLIVVHFLTLSASTMTESDYIHVTLLEYFLKFRISNMTVYDSVTILVYS